MTKYEDIFFRLSTPNGLVNVGWKLENKKRSSKIVCLICRIYFAENLEELARHILREHLEAAFFLRLRNWKKMII